MIHIVPDQIRYAQKNQICGKIANNRFLAYKNRDKASGVLSKTIAEYSDSNRVQVFSNISKAYSDRSKADKDALKYKCFKQRAFYRLVIKKDKCMEKLKDRSKAYSDMSQASNYLSRLPHNVVQ